MKEKKLNRKLLIGLLLLAVPVLAALFAPWIAPQDPTLMDWSLELQKPNSEYWLGNDNFGRDILSRLIYGARLSLGVALSVVTLSLTLGTLIGLIAGYWGGWVDQFFVFICDIFLSFPSILLLIAIAGFVPPSLFNVILILSFVGWVGYARLIRAQVLEMKSRDFVLAMQSVGASNLRILIKHILPNVFGPLIIAASLGVAGVILAESTLSFLGLGIPPDVPAWGAMLGTGVRFLLNAPHLAIFSGLAIMMTVLSFQFLGDYLRDRLTAKQ